MVFYPACHHLLITPYSPFLTVTTGYKTDSYLLVGSTFQPLLGICASEASGWVEVAKKENLCLEV